MNSLTPVASLAQTASLLLEDLRGSAGEAPELAELDEAVDAIHRRSAGLMRFVEGYRRFAEPPEPMKRQLPLAELFDRARRLEGAALAASGITVETRIEPPGLAVQADPDLLDQVLVNLIKNAIEAVEDSAEKRITLTGDLDARGRVVVTIADTGAGLPPELAEQIFVPFFTTQAEGLRHRPAHGAPDHDGAWRHDRGRTRCRRCAVQTEILSGQSPGGSAATSVPVRWVSTSPRIAAASWSARGSGCQVTQSNSAVSAT
ncbi:MAG: ATP-binding protein [Aliidongia sp.]